MCVTQKRFFLDFLIIDQCRPMKGSPDSGTGKLLAWGALKSEYPGQGISNLACESIPFFRLKFLVSPAEKNRLLKRAEKKSACFRKRFFSAGETRNLSGKKTDALGSYQQSH